MLAGAQPRQSTSIQERRGKSDKEGKMGGRSGVSSGNIKRHQKSRRGVWKVTFPYLLSSEMEGEAKKKTRKEGGRGGEGALFRSAVQQAE